MAAARASIDAPSDSGASRTPRRARTRAVAAISRAARGRAPAAPCASARRSTFPRRDDEALDAVADDRAGVGRDDAGQPARQRLVGDHGRPLEQRREDEHVGRGHPRGDLGVRDPAERLDLVEIGAERSGVRSARRRAVGASSRAVGFAARPRGDT